MKLKNFRIQNFRSVEDSGVINVDEITAIVGRNESGKSNLLLALASINPREGRQNLSKIKDFPRNRRLEQCTETTPVVTTIWELEVHEREELGEQLPGADQLTEVEIGRYYKNLCWVNLKLERPSLNLKEVKGVMRRLIPHMSLLIEEITPESSAAVQSVWTNFQSVTLQISNSQDWASNVTKIASELRKILLQANATLSTEIDQIINNFEEQADEIISCIITIDAFVFTEIDCRENYCS